MLDYCSETGQWPCNDSMCCKANSTRFLDGLMIPLVRGSVPSNDKPVFKGVSYFIKAVVFNRNTLEWESPGCLSKNNLVVDNTCLDTVMFSGQLGSPIKYGNNLNLKIEQEEFRSSTNRTPFGVRYVISREIVHTFFNWNR